MCSPPISTTTTAAAPIPCSGFQKDPPLSILDPSMPMVDAEGRLPFAEEEMVVDEHLGYPRAFAKLCGDASHRFGPYGKGPPFEFHPYALPTQELVRAKDLNQMFPIIGPEAKPSENPNNFLNLLWKQLSHLGNAGFDPELFRVDMYGNVLYFYADHASPLSWEIDHWFPRSRGGRTVPSNLRIFQWQVCKRKHNRLEFLIPWWDVQLGISVNQFLSILASKNSDFRKRAFSFLFIDGGKEELNDMQVVESHKFPEHFIEKKRQVGLAPAAIISSQKHQGSPILKPLSSKTKYPSICEQGTLFQRPTPRVSKENENPNVDSNNSYMSIVLARDSLRKREDKKKLQGEITILENEMEELKQKNDDERFSIQKLEMSLIRKRRKVEKTRRLAEAQSSYKELLERMIRDAMHQNVVYKEQLRLNQAATSALMVRLEAQRAMCDDSEKELLKKDKKKDEIEKQIRSLSETAKKRSRMDDAQLEEQDDELNCSFPMHSMAIKPTRKELRQFLEEEQRAYAARLSMIVDAQGDDSEEEATSRKASSACQLKERTKDVKHKRLILEERSCSKIKGKERFSDSPNPVVEDDDELKYEVGKNNIEKWLQVLLDNAREDGSPSPDLSPPRRTNSENHTDEVIHKMNLRISQEEIKYLRLKAPSEKEDSIFNCNDLQKKGKSPDENMREEKVSNTISEKRKGDRGSCSGEDNGLDKSVQATASKHQGMVRSASVGNLRSRLSSPSLIPAMSNKLFKTCNSAMKKL